MRVLITLGLALITLTLNAQGTSAPVETELNKLIESANQALNLKDYKNAFASYSKAITLYEAKGETDAAIYYNAGYSASKAKLYDEAIPYFEKAIEMEYKEGDPYQQLSKIYTSKKDVEKSEEILLKGIAKYPNDNDLKTLMCNSQIKQGLAFYREGNKIKKAANESGMSQTEPDAYTAELEKANAEFSKSLPFFEKALEYDADNKNAIKALINVYTSLDMNEQAEALKAKFGNTAE